MQLVAYVKLHKCTTPPLHNESSRGLHWVGPRQPNPSIERFQWPAALPGNWKKKCLRDKSSTATGLVWETAVPFVSGTSMTAVTSRENTLLTNLKQLNQSLTWLTPVFPRLGQGAFFTSSSDWLCVICIFCDWPMVMTSVSTSRPSC